MSKKVFAILLVAVFVLAQFGVAAAAPAPALATGTGSVSVETFSHDANTATVAVDVNATYTWKGVTIDATNKYVVIWARIKQSPAVDYTCVATSGILTTANGNGSFSTATTPAGTPIDLTTPLILVADDDDIEFFASIDDVATCVGGPTQPGALAAKQDVTVLDLKPVWGFVAGPPASKVAPAIDYTAACNTFEVWGLIQDLGAYNGLDEYSGVNAFGNYSNITSASGNEYTAAVGSDWMMSSQSAVIPSTATAVSWYARPSDKAGNKVAAPGYAYYDMGVAVTSGEKANCKSFTDEASVYARYLADAGLIGGYADGSFGGSNVLNRAEFSTLIEGANGKTVDVLPTSAPAGCSFSDVAATDWFAGWVWQACKDGFVGGYADGSFGPYDTLTRAQVAQVFDNVIFNSTVTNGGYLATGYDSVLRAEWQDPTSILMLRYPDTVTGDFADVDGAAYYYLAAFSAYGSGIFDATDADQTMFSPDQPVTREDFSQILYRAFSAVNQIP